MRTLLLMLLSCGLIHAGTSNSLLDVSPDGKQLIAANRDNDSVTIVDLATRKVLHEIPVGHHPEGVSWVGGGPMALVTLHGGDQVVFIDTTAGKTLHKLKVENEPYGIVVTKDGKKAYVSHDYPGLVSEIDIDARKVLRTIKSGEWSRGIAIDNDEKMVYVTDFYAVKLHAIDLAAGKVVDTWSGHETQNICRHVVLHPKRPKAYLSHIVSRVTHTEGRGAIFPEVTICDLWQPKKPDDKRRKSIAMDTYNGVYVTANPWETALTPDGKKIFTVYAGTDDVNVSTVIDDDYVEMERISLPFKVGKNPRAVRVSPNGKEFYIFNTLDFAVSVYDVASLRKETTITLCQPPKSPEWVRGKVLFQTATLSGAKWISCSSCHPDGLTDGRTWHNGEGLRRVPPLLGLAHTHPLHWSADRDEVQDFEYTIRSKLMNARGLVPGPLKPKVGFKPIELDEKMSDRSKDLDALAIYTNSFNFRLSPHLSESGKLSPAAERGKAIFTNKETNCASCHSGPFYSDSKLAKPFNLHDVGTGLDDPGEKIGPRYDTPTLLGVYRNTQYLHHGKAKTLMDVLTTFNLKDQHGKTSHLTKEQKEDLVEFLKALPYEMPPDEVPNTVPYRYKDKMKPD
ncbi:MAG: beta-propeller fold lactonase family protein [Planctomycetes bacterium]|nr:beta-propeller fold lactonase family protein [Planctomycetota bacterium]